MKKPITVAIVGFGYWGPNLVRNFRSLPECRLKTVCDLSEKRLKHMHSLYPDVAGETDFSKLVNDPEVDAVVIATSARLHYPMAKSCLEAGKHVLIEKPMACATSECEELIQIAKQRGLVVMVGHTFLYSAAVRKIKEIVDNHDLGDLRYIAARRLNLGLFQKDINVAWDLAPHDISIILHIMQELPQSVNCRGGASLTPGIQDMTSMSLHFTKERSAIIHSSWHDPRKVREMTIVGSKRMIVYDDIAPLEKIKVYDVRVERPPHYNSFAEFQYAYHYGDTYSPYIKHDEPLHNECQHFADCIANGTVPLTSGASGLEVVRILEASSKSLANQGAPVALWSGSSAPFPVPRNTSQPSATASHGKNGTPAAGGKGAATTAA
ncbi:Gfo/Idh/MocA family protein [Horticoccus sp. 23ND18S-11]|uniref:Gfo/Idh/MocA family protein n=1 Tax=Horticoccus sp. 23ND18S-11 TaxID=3391832 RepID=UPI0039C9638C